MMERPVFWPDAKKTWLSFAPFAVKSLLLYATQKAFNREEREDR